MRWQVQVREGVSRNDGTSESNWLFVFAVAMLLMMTQRLSATREPRAPHSYKTGPLRQKLARHVISGLFYGKSYAGNYFALGTPLYSRESTYVFDVSDKKSAITVNHSTA
eukprot:scaffold92_cov85-Cylindrotheca_fusiformis.AAC.5